jgi:hypothetical protein
MPSSPALFNSGTRRAQASSCYLLDSPADNLEAIDEKSKDVALPEVFEKLRAAAVDGIVQLPYVGRDERGQAFGDQFMLFARCNGLGKGMNVLIGDFLRDESIEQPGGKLRIFRLIRDERSGAKDRVPWWLLR